MKKLLVIAALTIAAAPAMASKARLNALANSAQLVDAQTIWVRPSNLVSLGNWATVELGATTPSTTTAGTYAAATTPFAEGGFSRSMGDAYLGFYMGHHNDQVTNGRLTAFPAGLTEENPIDLYYAAKMGDMAWGAGIWYSMSDKKGAAGQPKQSSMGVRASVEVANADAYVSYGITDTSENATAKQTGSAPITLGAGYAMDAWYFFADLSSQEAKVTPVATGTDSKLARSNWRVGAVNTTKAEGSNFFWGVSYEASNAGKELANTATTALPFLIGLEHDAASWLTVRGSVKQTVLLSSTKSIGDASTQDNNTMASAGVGIKFSKLVLDATISKTVAGTAGSTGDINGNNLLTNAALTYMF